MKPATTPTEGSELIRLDFIDILTTLFKARTLSTAELITIISFAFLLLSFFNLYSYYSLFGIDISSYLEVSEIVFSFSPLLLFAIFLITFVTGQQLIVSIVRVIKEAFVNKDTPRKVKNWVFAITLLILMALMYLFLVLISQTFIHPKSNDYHIWLIAIILLVPFLPMNSRIKYGATLLISIILIQRSNVREFEEVTVNHNPKYNIQFGYKDKTISSTVEFLYIGSTKNYIFLWDECEVRVAAYPLNQIEWMTTQGNRKQMVKDCSFW